MGVGVEEEDGVGGPAGVSEGEGGSEEVEETEQWLLASPRPCRRDTRVLDMFCILFLTAAERLNVQTHSLHLPASLRFVVLGSW